MGGPAPAVAPHRRSGGTQWPGPAAAAAVYLLAALALTWPLVTRLTTAIAWDLGDPLLNSWILAWGADHLWRFVSGDLDALSAFWHANIFHPSPYALAYSEHLLPQAVQVLPVWALTNNPVLCYNLLFVSTFVLSGVGTYLLVRELTGDARVALVAGLCYAFAPYRIGQYSHLQVLSSGWMPIALYGLVRYFDGGRVRALAGATAALVAQVLSCGYYLLFFTPVFAAYVLFGIATRPHARTRRTGLQLALAGVITAAVTWPFVQPYRELRALEFPKRPLQEVAAFSADVRGYLTAHQAQWIWGHRLRAYPRPEGELFPGVAVLLLATCAVAVEALARWRAARDLRARGWRRAVERGLVLTVASATLVLLAVLLTGGISTRVWGVPLRASGVTGVLLRTSVVVLLLLAVSGRARMAFAGWLRTETAWLALVLVGAAVLSCGPTLRSGGRALLDPAPYAWLYDVVPGFDGLRVPARFGMLVALCLSVLAGIGLHRLTSGTRRAGAWLAIAGFLMLAEGGAAPIPLSAGEPPDMYAAPSRELYVEGRPPAVYEAVDRLRADAVVLELPLGSPAWDVRAVFYSTVHWRKLVNGYSGGFPQRYVAMVASLAGLETNPAMAWSSVHAAGATHVIVHRSAYQNGGDAPVVQWLETGGATRLGDYGTDRLYRLQP
jgi:hypothetical protein